MILKKLLGEILRELGFITKNELTESLRRQREHFERQALPEFLQRNKVVREARLAKEAHATPMLGEIILNMGFATDDQIKKALNEQDNFLDLYKSIGSEKLGIAVEIISIINSTLNLAEVLSHLMRHANRVTNSESSTLMLLDEETNELVFSVPTGPNSGILTDIRIPYGTGIAGWVAENEQYVLVPDVGEDSRFYPEIDKMTGLETKSILCVPLKSKSKLIGVLEVINKEDGSAFTLEDAMLLSLFASQAAMAIENARLYGELEDRLEEEREMQKALAESEKLSALGQLSSGLAHDFNNILAAIMGYVEMAMYEIPKTNIARQSLDQVLIASHRAKDLVRQILAFNRRSERVHKPVRLSAVVKEVLSLVRASIPSTIKIVQHLKSDSSVIMADTTQIHQVLMNLCTNAHHSMRESGGTLEISLRDFRLTKKDISTYPDLAPGAYLKLSVRDTGHGMDPQTLQKAFEPYFTTKEKEVGTGMGLAVVQGIVKNHNGTINVKSAPGKGTTIDVLFPKIEAVVKPEDENSVEVLGGMESILFVDDEEPLIDIGENMLKQLGYTVVAKSCPKEALKVFQKDPKRFDLVITDMTMPNMTGDLLAGKLMAIRSDIPIILCTGHSDLITQERVRELGIKGFLLKPHSMQDLAASVRNVLNQPQSNVVE